MRKGRQENPISETQTVFRKRVASTRNAERASAFRARRLGREFVGCQSIMDRNIERALRQLNGSRAGAGRGSDVGAPRILRNKANPGPRRQDKAFRINWLKFWRGGRLALFCARPWRSGVLNSPRRVPTPSGSSAATEKLASLSFRAKRGICFLFRSLSASRFLGPEKQFGPRNDTKARLQ